MKSIPDILGGTQMLLDIDFNLQNMFENYLTGELRGFLATLRCIECTLPSEAHYLRARTGRPAYKMLPFMRAFLAQCFFRTPTMENLRKQLQSNANLRKICGFHEVPSLPTFSRRLSELADDKDFAHTLEHLVTEHLSERITGNVLRDSTAIPAREAPSNKKSDVQRSPPPHRHGRPKKGERRSPVSQFFGF